MMIIDSLELYTGTGSQTEEEEYAITSKWITDLSGDPVYR